jgi:nucleotidyltransferase substrate binding protein (TIGR01987 family)
MNEDIRWKQRFDNYTYAIKLLEQAINLKELDIFQQAGMIQFFEMCSELSWKLMKDYLEEHGFNDLNTPRGAIKQAFNSGIIKDGHSWMQLLSDRNLTSHIYNEAVSQQIIELIRYKYYPMFQELFVIFNEFKNA